jgi:hypothetical protein
MGEHDNLDQRWWHVYRVPRGLPAPLWYTGLGLGGLALCVTVGGLMGTLLALVNAWFR